MKKGFSKRLRQSLLTVINDHIFSSIVKQHNNIKTVSYNIDKTFVFLSGWLTKELTFQLKITYLVSYEKIKEILQGNMKLFPLNKTHFDVAWGLANKVVLEKASLKRSSSKQRFYVWSKLTDVFLKQPRCLLYLKRCKSILFFLLADICAILNMYQFCHHCAVSGIIYYFLSGEGFTGIFFWGWN